MKKLLFVILFAVVLMPLSAAAQSRYIVRDSYGLNSLLNSCLMVGCTVNQNLDNGLGQLYLVTNTDTSSGGLLGDLFGVVDFVTELLGQPGIQDVEPNVQLHLLQYQMSAPSSLYDTNPVSYYGSTVWQGYLDQPATQMIDLQSAQSGFRDTGAGVVAIIDTGVDPSQPVLQPVLLSGYDFTRNQQGGSEMADVSQYSMAVVNQFSMAVVNQYSMAVVNQDEVTTLQQSSLSDFGHGTMVAGVVHLVAPTARILPLKAFNANGSGYLSDVLRALYYAVQNGANVINMSFDLPNSSNALQQAITYANQHGVVCVASVGNDGQNTAVYPAAYGGNVMGIASVSNSGSLSSFSNYGKMVFAGAPGEGVVTTYPLASYAAGWGTSFSAPFVSGGVALLLGLHGGLNESGAATALAHATAGKNLGNGILNLENALQAWQDTE